MAQRVTKTVSGKNFLFGRIEWLDTEVKVIWEGQSWHGYEGAAGKEFFDSEYGRTEYHPIENEVAILPEKYNVEY